MKELLLEAGQEHPKTGSDDWTEQDWQGWA